MIDLFNNNNQLLVNVASILIHAAKIDGAYTDEEKDIIKRALIKMGAKTSNLEKIMNDATNREAESNQILDFTREIKKMNEKDKIKIIETLWRVILSDEKADMYEANLMRRLSGLFYIGDNMMGQIKQKIKKETFK